MEPIRHWEFCSLISFHVALKWCLPGTLLVGYTLP